MSAEQRLDRLYPALTAKERAIMALQHYRAGTEEDPAIRATIPFRQWDEFNRLLRLTSAVNTEVAYVLMLVNAQVRQVDIKYGWLMSLLLWGIEIECVCDHLIKATKDRAIRRDVRKMMKRSPGALQVPIDLTAPQTNDPFKEGYGRGLVVALLTGIKEGIERHWRELRSVEIAVAEVAATEFDGEDLFQPDVQSTLDEAKEMLKSVHEAIAHYVEPFELGEPSDEDMELARKLISKAAEG